MGQSHRNMLVREAPASQRGSVMAHHLEAPQARADGGRADHRPRLSDSSGGMGASRYGEQVAAICA